MTLANASSLPDMPSASVMQASLPDWTTMPWIKSLTLTSDLRFTNMADVPEGPPPVRQACSETLNVVSILSVPDFNASNATASVMSLLMLAGGTSLSASFS